MDVVVTGIGLVSALGPREQTWKRLLAGETEIHRQQPFAQLPALPLALIDHTPIGLEMLTRQVVGEALQDAQLTPPLPDCAVVVGSSRSNQATWELLGTHLRKGRPLERWLDSLPHAPAIATAQMIGTGSAVHAPMAACATGLWAIAQGYELIRTGTCDRVLAGAVEAPITPLTLTGFERMGALAQTGAYPFDGAREGLVLGEGGALLVLESADLARDRAAPIYGYLLGVGLTADGYHVSAPQPESRAARIAVQQCLARSGLQPDQVDFIHAHGTATQLNDRNEAALIQHLFVQPVPVSSTKGATGHTIGASGALGMAFSLLALKHQRLPPTVGLTRPAFDLDFVTAARSAAVEYALCLSFGFGGQNAAIALGQKSRPWE